MHFKFKKYWRKTGLNEEWGTILLNLIVEKKPKHFLEIGVFCGVTSRNVCEVLSQIHEGDFSYTGVDLFGEKTQLDKYESVPKYIENQKFSNPLKHFYYNLLMRENLNSIESVEKFLKKFKKNIHLIKGDTNKVLKEIDLSNIDFAFIDGGHSYKTVLNDLKCCNEVVKNNGIILCDDYDLSFAPGVKKAVDEFVLENNFDCQIICNKRFAKIQIK